MRPERQKRSSSPMAARHGRAAPTTGAPAGAGYSRSSSAASLLPPHKGVNIISPSRLMSEKLPSCHSVRSR